MQQQCRATCSQRAVARTPQQGGQKAVVETTTAGLQHVSAHCCESDPWGRWVAGSACLCLLEAMFSSSA
eukprot:4566358-Amphidinium_carterae.1